MDRLPDGQRAVPALAPVEGMPGREVARALGRSGRTVRDLQLRVLRRLHRLIKEAGHA